MTRAKAKRRKTVRGRAMDAWMKLACNWSEPRGLTPGEAFRRGYLAGYRAKSRDDRTALAKLEKEK